MCFFLEAAYILFLFYHPKAADSRLHPTNYSKLLNIGVGVGVGANGLLGFSHFEKVLRSEIFQLPTMIMNYLCERFKSIIREFN